MALITDQPFFAVIDFLYYSGQSNNSYGSQDLQGLLTGLVRIPFTQDTEFASTAPSTTGYNTYYKMQGWNPLTQRYEDWHSMGTPLLIPPSGHTLQNIGIIGTWTDR